MAYKFSKKSDMAVSIQIEVNENLYLRNPQESKLGKKIIQYSILLIDEIGIEQFTFKKLAERIQSTEASIYRYFENKHLLLVYLLSWYWEWMKFRIDFNTMNLSDPREKLKIVIKTIVDTIRLSKPAEFIDRDSLHKIVLREGPKAYHIKEVDEENKKGFFLTYKALAGKIAKIILEANPTFPYPKSLASTLLEMSNNHIYFAQHLPSLTDVKFEDGQLEQDVESLMVFFALKLIE